MIFDFLHTLWKAATNEGLHRILRTCILLGIVAVLQSGFRQFRPVGFFFHEVSQLRSEFTQMKDYDAQVKMYIKNAIERAEMKPDAVRAK